MYMDLGLKSILYAKSLIELKLKKGVQGWLIIVRLGHEHLNAYYKKFGYKCTNLNYFWDQKKL